MNSPTEPLVQSPASGPSVDRRRGRPALLRRTGALSAAAVLTLATFAATLTAAPAAGEPNGRHRDGWRDRRDHDDRDRWRHDDRRRDRDRWERRDRDRGHRRWEGRDHRGWDRHDRGRGRGHQRFERNFRAPARIDSFHRYERYHYGRVFYPAHRHHHRILAFPYEARGAVHYVPHAYCGDALFGTGAFFYDGPRLSIRWSF